MDCEEGPFSGTVARDCCQGLLPGTVYAKECYHGTVVRDCWQGLLPGTVAWDCCQGRYPESAEYMDIRKGISLVGFESR